MKVLAVSDRVLDTLYTASIQQRYADIDLLIGCGDLPYYFLEFLVSALDAPMVYVLGNHDRSPQYSTTGRELTGVQGGHDIHARCLHIESLIIAGLQGSMRYKDHSSLMYTEAEMRLEISKLLPRLLFNKIIYGRYLDIFVTHSPPFGIHDRLDIAHTGFKIFLPFLRLFKPKYMLHGHIHRYRRDEPYKTQYEQTSIINVYPYHCFEVT